MKKLGFLAWPLGLSLLVVGAGWASLAPRALPWLYRGALVAGLVLAAIGLWARRETLFAPGGGKKVRLGASAMAGTGMALVILLLVNFAAARYRDQWDLTRTRAFTLHPVTLRVLEKIEDPVDVYAFFPASDPLTVRTVRELYELFAYHQPLLKVEVVDPNRRPDLVEKAGVTGTNVTVVLCGDRKVVFPGYDEADLAAALLEVTRKEPKKVYWVIGHGERQIDVPGGRGYQRFRQELKKEYYRLETLSLGAGEEVPADASLVVFADPGRSLSPVEAAIYDRWLRRGGRALVLVDVDFAQRADEANRMAALLDRWGLRPFPGLVFDPRSRTGEQDPRIVVGDVFGKHPAVSSLEGSLAIFPFARPVEFFEVPDDRQIFHHVLVRVGPDPEGKGRDPYVDTNLARAEGSTTLDEDARRAWGGRPINLVVAAFRKFEPPPGSRLAGREARVVCAGDADFLDDENFDRQANRELAMNLVHWLTGEELLIRREGEKKLAKLAMKIEPEQWRFAFAMVLTLPIAIFLAGWVVWFLRRSK